MSLSHPRAPHSGGCALSDCAGSPLSVKFQSPPGAGRRPPMQPLRVGALGPDYQGFNRHRLPAADATFNSARLHQGDCSFNPHRPPAVDAISGVVNPPIGNRSFNHHRPSAGDATAPLRFRVERDRPFQFPPARGSMHPATRSAMRMDGNSFQPHRPAPVDATRDRPSRTLTVPVFQSPSAARGRCNGA